MLKLDGFIDLTSCLGEARKKAHLEEGLPLRPKEQEMTQPPRTRLSKLLPAERSKRAQSAAFAKGRDKRTLSHQHLDKQACAVIPPQWLQGRLLAEGNVDSEADMLSGISRKRNAHSRYY